MLMNQLKNNIDMKQKTNRRKFGFEGQRLLRHEPYLERRKTTNKDC